MKVSRIQHVKRMASRRTKRYHLSNHLLFSLIIIFGKEHELNSSNNHAWLSWPLHFAACRAPHNVFTGRFSASSVLEELSPND